MISIPLIVVLYLFSTVCFLLIVTLTISIMTNNSIVKLIKEFIETPILIIETLLGGVAILLLIFSIMIKFNLLS